MYERILIPLDGSKVGEAALPYVNDLISKFGPKVKVEITLLQVISPVAPVAIGGFESAPLVYDPSEVDRLGQMAFEYLNEVGKIFKRKGVNVIPKAIVGRPHEEIKKAADDDNIDVIAMSTHGRSGLSRWAFGSVTDRVLRSRTKPVLLVRAPKPDMKNSIGEALVNINSELEH